MCARGCVSRRALPTRGCIGLGLSARCARRARGGSGAQPGRTGDSLVGAQGSTGARRRVFAAGSTFITARLHYAKVSCLMNDLRNPRRHVSARILIDRAPGGGVDSSGRDGAGEGAVAALALIEGRLARLSTMCFSTVFMSDSL